ncbi:uncharacterized protein LOC144114974 [Amblyomma americanum]
METSGVIPSVSAKQMSPPGSHEAATASGNGACSEADQLDDIGSYEMLIEQFVRDLEDQSMREEALPDSSKKQAATPSSHPSAGWSTTFERTPEHRCFPATSARWSSRRAACSPATAPGSTGAHRCWVWQNAGIKNRSWIKGVL